MYRMIEHPEIVWVERTGHPSWMQVRDLDVDDEEYDDDDEEE